MFKRESRQDQYFCEVPCAYHGEHLITNFCTHPGCLLPLCPRCISIHNQQHVRMGSPSSFEPIEECARKVLRDLTRSHQQALAQQQLIEQKICQFKRSAALAVDQIREHAETVILALEKELEFIVFNLTKAISDEESGLIAQMAALEQELGIVAEDYDVLGRELFTDKFLSGIIGFYTEEKVDFTRFEQKTCQPVPEIVTRVDFDRLQDLKERLKQCIVLDFGHFDRSRAKQASPKGVVK